MSYRRCAAEGTIRKEGANIAWKALIVEDSPNLLEFVVTLPGRVIKQTLMATAHQAPLVATRLVREAA